MIEKVSWKTFIFSIGPKQILAIIEKYNYIYKIPIEIKYKKLTKQTKSQKNDNQHY